MVIFGNEQVLQMKLPNYSKLTTQVIFFQNYAVEVPKFSILGKKYPSKEGEEGDMVCWIFENPNY